MKTQHNKIHKMNYFALWRLLLERKTHFFSCVCVFPVFPFRLEYESMCEGVRNDWVDERTKKANLSKWLCKTFFH